MLTDNWKAFFWGVFLCFFTTFSLFVFFCFFFCSSLLEGLRVRWGGRRATSLGPKPSLVLFCFVLCFCFEGLRVRWGPEPSLFLFSFVFVFFSFLSLLLKDKKTLFFLLEKGILFLLECLPLFLLSLFWPPPFSTSLSLSPSCSIVSFFLLVFLLLSFCSFFFIFLSFSFFFALVSWTEQHQNTKLLLSFLKYFFFFWFPVFFFLSNPFFLSLLFPDFKLCFLLNINVFGLKKPKLKNTNFWSKGGLQQNVFFFMSLCFAICEK